MSDPIAPCPFCGNAVATRLDAITDVDAWAYCDNCSACGPIARTEAEAIAAWNAVEQAIARQVARIIEDADTPPARRCDHCGLPLVSAHLADQTIITDGVHRVSVHRACASAYPGWTVVAQARGM